MSEIGHTTSSVQLPPDVSSSSDGPPEEDLQAMVKLYQKCPGHWGGFRDIGNAVHLMATKTKGDMQLCNALWKVSRYCSAYTKNPEEMKDIGLYMSLAGYVEKGVAFYRRVLRNMGKSYITEYPTEAADARGVDPIMKSLYFIRNDMTTCTVFSPEFSVRLAKTGFLQDIMEDIRHMQHLTAEALVRDSAFLLSVGTLHNCSTHPENAAVVSQLDIASVLTPFLSKRGPDHFVQSAAMGVLANVVKEDELHRLALSAGLLQYYVSTIEGALSSGQSSHKHWYASIVLFDLCLLARNDFNKRLMVAQGILQTLQLVLEPSKKRSEREKRHAVTLICRLLEDQTNLQICQNHRELVEVLQGLRQDGASQTMAEVPDILAKLGHRNGDLEDRLSSTPHLADLLADQCNVLIILNMGLVEFVLDEVKVFTKAQGGTAASGGDDAGQKVLKALRELASEDVYRREILSRGGLGLMHAVLKDGSLGEQREAAKVVLELCTGPENRLVVQLDTELRTLLEEVRQKADNKDLAQAAESILQVLKQEHCDGEE